LNDQGEAYEMGDGMQGDVLTLEIRDSTGRLLRTFSSRSEKNSVTYDGAPPANPVLPHEKGINRFVWNLRMPTIPGIPNVYIESSFYGHKVPPGQYILVLKRKNSGVTKMGVVIANPVYQTESETYQQYHQLMTEMEGKVTTMHNMVNLLYSRKKLLDEVLTGVTDEKLKDLKEKGRLISEKIRAWDEEMVQRKSKAYDDVENFPNKFSANYLFLLNQTEGDIPRINEATLVRKKELDIQWEALEKRGQQLILELTNYREELSEAGVNMMWK